MSKEIEHGYFQEFKRTPEEERAVKDRKKIKELECRVEVLEKELEEIRNAIGKGLCKEKR